MEKYTVSFPGLGLEFDIDRVAFSVAGVPIYWYGLLIAAGLMLAVVWCFRHAVEFGVDSDRLLDVVCVGTVMAIVCARIYYVVMSPYAYDSIWEMLDIRQGGIAIYGAIFGAFFFGGLACIWRKIPVLATFDLVSLGFLIGQGIGRWGNFVNQEAFGYNTTLPWGMYSEKTREYLETSVVTLPTGMVADPALPVHPTFLYESLWCLVGFCMLALYYKKRCFNGDVALRYAIWYGLGRFWIEGLRTDSLLLVPSLNLRASQLVAAVTVLLALALELYLTRNAKKKGVMQVKLAVQDATLKQARRMHCAVFTMGGADSLPVTAPLSEFEKATEAYNADLQEKLKKLAETQQNLENKGE